MNDLTAASWHGRPMPAGVDMPATSAEYARRHAYEFAGGDRSPHVATTYADWYAGQYLPGADSLNDLPDHPTAWLRFLDHEREAEAGA